MTEEPKAKGKLGMSQKAKEAMGESVPRWATALLLAACVFFLSRLVKQHDVVVETVNSHSVTIAANTTSIVALNKATQSTSETLAKVDQIARLLEQRLLGLEMKEEKRKP